MAGGLGDGVLRLKERPPERERASAKSVLIPASINSKASNTRKKGVKRVKKEDIRVHSMDKKIFLNFFTYCMV